MALISLKNVSYHYKDGGNIREIFNDVTYEFEKGKFYLILGESGSGKTTLLSLLAGIINPKEGHIEFKDLPLLEIGLNEYRKNNVSLVFQNYNLIDYLSAYENVAFAMDIADKKVIKEQVYGLLNLFGINDNLANKSVNKLSGGEQQRVAIARALARDSEVILADEPTGNLDQKTSVIIMDTFRQLCDKYNKTVIMVTHNRNFISLADETIFIDQNALNLTTYAKD